MSQPTQTHSRTDGPPLCAVCGTRARRRAQLVDSIAHCPKCHVDLCWIDGQPIATHVRCKACGILIGPRHVTTHMRDGLCPPCLDWRSKGLPTPTDDDEELLELHTELSRTGTD